MLPFLTDFWRDVWTVFGVVGTAATLVGLWVAIVQIRRTATAAEAAQRAAEQAGAEHRRQVTRYVVSTSHRLIREAGIHVESRSWALAAVRMGDLAEQMVIFQRATGAAAPGVTAPDPVGMATELRDWATQFNRLQAGEIEWSHRLRSRWARSFESFSSKIDAHIGPEMPDGPVRRPLSENQEAE